MFKDKGCTLVALSCDSSLTERRLLASTINCMGTGESHDLTGSPDREGAGCGPGLPRSEVKFYLTPHEYNNQT